MKAAVIHGYGEAFDTLAYEDVRTPAAGPGELVIKIHACGVNHCDTDLRKGLFGVESAMPHVMGVDAAGEVAEVGTGVTRFKEGDRVAPHFMLSCGACDPCLAGRENLCTDAGVLGVTVWGGYADYVKVRQDHVVRLPDALSYDDAVAGQIPFATAWEALIEVIELRAGETVLVTAAGGGVGSAGVQVAKLAGARVIAAAGSDEKLEKALALGADETINYASRNIGAEARRLTGGRGVDAALEMTGGAILVQSIDALAPGGRLATIGAHGGERVEIDFIEFFRKHISVHGCGRSTKAQVERVLHLIAAGTLKPVIHRTFDLREAPSAHALMESRNFFGRMIMRP